MCRWWCCPWRRFASMVTFVTATVWPVKVMPVRFALLMVAPCDAGVNANPLLLGVTV